MAQTAKKPSARKPAAKKKSTAKKTVAKKVTKTAKVTASRRARRREVDEDRSEDRTLSEQRLFELLDEAVAARIDAVKADLKLTDKIAEYADELIRRDRRGWRDVVSHVKRVDRRDGQVKPISHQMLYLMISARNDRLASARKASLATDQPELGPEPETTSAPVVMANGTLNLGT
jgi:hypothetical protein